jgi:hypothetical protein
MKNITKPDNIKPKKKGNKSRSNANKQDRE